MAKTKTPTFASVLAETRLTALHSDLANLAHAAVMLEKSIAQDQALLREIHEAAPKAEAGELTLDDLKGLYNRARRSV